MRRAMMKCLFPVMAVAVCASAWGASFPIRFDDALYLRLPVGTSDGIVPGHPGAADTVTLGELRDKDGAVVGRVTVISADESDSVARVDTPQDARGLEAVRSVAFPALGREHLRFDQLDSERFFVIEAGTRDHRALRAGSKGELLTGDGRVGALFTTVAVGSERGIGRITEYAEGVFNRQLLRGRLVGILHQVVGSTGFANLTLANLVMLLIGALFIYLGIAKEYEPLLLVPIGFGILIGNIPLPLQIFNAVSVYMIDPVTHQYVFSTATTV